MSQRLRLTLDPGQRAGNAVVRVERANGVKHPRRFDVAPARMFFAPDGRTIDDALAELRDDPRLAALNTPVVRTTEDTEALWAAWRIAMLDTVLEIAQARLRLEMHRAVRSDGDVIHADELAIRDLRRRLQAAMATWREHEHHLSLSRETVLATIADRAHEVDVARQVLDERCDGLRQTARCAATARVLRGAAAALEATLEERRALKEAAYVRDRDGHLGVIRALAEALVHFVASFRADVEQTKKESTAAAASVNAAIEQRRRQWQEVCGALRRNYLEKVHRPLSQLLTELRAAPTQTLEVTAGALDDASDPYCIKRCGVAIAELDAVCAHLAKLSVGAADADAPGAGLDDPELLEARALRGEEETAAVAEAARQADALRLERNTLEEAGRRARRHLELLRSQADALRHQVQPRLLETAAGNDPRRVATITRVIQQRQANLRDDMVRTSARLTELGREIAAARQRVPVGARHAEAARLRGVAAAVHNVCVRMRDQFESVQSEEMLRRIVSDQFVQSARTLHAMTESVIQRAAAVARAQYGKIEADISRCHDEIAEASRRIDTLNQARIENHTGVSGEEIAVFSALEEWVAVSNELHSARDLLAHMDGLSESCTAAIALLHDVTRDTHEHE